MGQVIELDDAKVYTKCGFCKNEINVEDAFETDGFLHVTHYCNQLHAEMDLFMHESLITEMAHRFKEFSADDKHDLRMAIHSAIKPYLAGKDDE